MIIRIRERARVIFYSLFCVLGDKIMDRVEDIIRDLVKP